MKTKLNNTIAAALLIAASLTSHSEAQNASDKYRAQAIRLYPSLAEKDSALNKAFVALYQERLRSNPKSLESPDWPMKLAQELANSIDAGNPREKTPERKAAWAQHDEAKRVANAQLLLVEKIVFATKQIEQLALADPTNVEVRENVAKAKAAQAKAMEMLTASKDAYEDALARALEEDRKAGAPADAKAQR